MARWVCGAARNLPTSDDSSWDGPAAERSMFDAAGWPDNPDPAKAKRGFLVSDESEPRLKSSYKLPFARSVDGKLTASRAGLRAAASRLPQTEVPPDVRQRAHTVIEGYMRQYHAADSGDGKMTGAGRLIEKLFDTEYEKALTAESALPLINKFALEPLAEGEVDIRRAKLANTIEDRSSEEFAVVHLERFRDTIIGKSMLPGHDKRQRPLARIFGASVEKRADGHHHLLIDYYMRKGSDIAEDVRLGIAKDLSIGFAADFLECSIDGGDYDRCQHRAGQVYDGEKCVARYAGDPLKYEAREASFVWLGCQHDTGTLAGKSVDDPFAGRVVWKAADLDFPDPAKGDDTMTEQELEKAEFEREIRTLKGQMAEMETKAKAGEAYFGSLKDGIIRKATALGDDIDIYTAALAGTNLDTLQKWDAALQKRFDEKFPPNANARMLSADPDLRMRGQGAKIAPQHQQDGSGEDERKKFVPGAGLRGGV